MISLYYLLLTLFLVLSFFLILLVLIQKGRGGGLSSAFGGVGGNTAFGAKTGDVLTWATSIVFGVFLFLAIGLNLLANRVERNNKQLYAVPTTAPAAVSNESMPVPVAAPPAPTTAPTMTPAMTPAMTPSTQPAVSTMSPPSVAPPTTQR